MSQYKVPNPYDLIQCPYDKTHMVDAKRFQRHLQKCGKQHPNAKVKKCPYNARHVVEDQSYRYHVANCPDRATLLPDIKYQAKRNGQEGTPFQGNCSVPAYSNWQPPASGENWDEELDESRVFFYGVSNNREEEYYDDEPEGPHVPVGLAPQDMPKEKESQKQGPSKIFEYSIRAAGVKAEPREVAAGGESWNSAPSRAPRQASGSNPWAPPVMENENKNQQNIAILQALGRGRGVGRGMGANQQSRAVGAIADNQERMYQDSTAQSQPSWAVAPAKSVADQSQRWTAPPHSPQSLTSASNSSSQGTVTEGNAVAASSALASQLQKRALGRGRAAGQVTQDKSLGRGRVLAAPSPQPGVAPQHAGFTQQPRGVTQQPSVPQGVHAIGRAASRPGGRPVNIANASGFSLGGRGVIKPSAMQPASGQPVFIVPKVNEPSIPPGLTQAAVAGSSSSGNPTPKDVGSDGETISESASQTSTDSNSDLALSSQNTVTTQKEIRKLQKKLREIEALEMRELGGESLKPEQISKVAKRHELVAKLNTLSLQE